MRGSGSNIISGKPPKVCRARMNLFPWRKRALLPQHGSRHHRCNVLRPMFVGNRLRLHTIPAFMSIVGGLLLFGAPGFILGPLAGTLTMLIVDFWLRRQALLQPTD